MPNSALQPNSTFPNFFSGKDKIPYPLFAGLAATVVVFISLFVVRYSDYTNTRNNEGIHDMAVLRSSLDSLWDSSASFSVHIANRLSATSRQDFPKLLESYKIWLPEVHIDLYDKDGNQIPGQSDNFFSSPPVTPTSPIQSATSALEQHTVRKIIAEALVGKSTKDLSIVDGNIALSSATPVRHEAVKAVVVSVVINATRVRTLTTLTHTDIAVLTFDGDKIAKTVGSFFEQGDRIGNEISNDLGKVLADKVPDFLEPLYLPTVKRYARLLPLHTEASSRIGFVVVVSTHGLLPPIFLIDLLISLVAGLLFSFVVLKLRQRRDGYMAIRIAGILSKLAEDDSATINYVLPPVLDEAIRNITGAMKAGKTLARVAVQERDDAVRKQNDCMEQKNSVFFDQYRRMIDSAPLGVFQMEPDGKFIMVNPAFAMLLGYDSPTHFLTECSTLMTLWISDGHEDSLPATALEDDAATFTLALRKRDGKARHFSISYKRFSFSENMPVILEGYLVDRSLEEQFGECDRKIIAFRNQFSSLSHMLAATCAQAMHFLRYQPNRGSTEQQDAHTSISSPDQQSEDYLAPIQSFFDDIRQIALNDPLESRPVSAPIELDLFLESVYEQAFPLVQSKALSLHLDMEDGLQTRVSGNAPILRHALLRILYAITNGVSGGTASISIARDHNAPRIAGSSRLIFSASWHSTTKAEESHRNSEILSEQNFETVYSIQSALQDGANDPLTYTDISDDRRIVRYILHKIHGQLLESIVNNDIRSISFAVQLDHLSAEPDEVLPDYSFLHSENVVLSDEGLYIGTAFYDSSNDLVPNLDDNASMPETISETEVLPSSNIASSANDIALQYENAVDAAFQQPLDILLIDDTLNNRLLFSIFLRETQHRIFEAHDGQEGVEAFKNGHFDVIFMSMEMSIMDGYQATRIIRAIEADSATAPTPIVSMTAYPLPEAKRQCVLSGCSEILPKPFNKNALLAMLNAFSLIKAGKAEIIN